MGKSASRLAANGCESSDEISAPSKRRNNYQPAKVNSKSVATADDDGEANGNFATLSQAATFRVVNSRSRSTGATKFDGAPVASSGSPSICKASGNDSVVQQESRAKRTIEGTEAPGEGPQKRGQRQAPSGPPVALVKFRPQLRRPSSPPLYVVACEAARGDNETVAALGAQPVELANCCNYANCFAGSNGQLIERAKVVAAAADSARATIRKSCDSKRATNRSNNPEAFGAAPTSTLLPNAIGGGVGGGGAADRVDGVNGVGGSAKLGAARSLGGRASGRDQAASGEQQVVVGGEEKLNYSKPQTAQSRGEIATSTSVATSDNRIGSSEKIKSGSDDDDGANRWLSIGAPHQAVALENNQPPSGYCDRRFNLTRNNNNFSQTRSNQILIQEKPLVVRGNAARRIGDEFEQDLNSIQGSSRHLAWNDIANRYGKMPRKMHRANMGIGLKNSCVAHLFCSLLYTLFPILNSFKGYSLPGDLSTDLFAGLTIGILHIPQGMAYGLLAGVDPINGLYTSLVPVTIMALMSKSRHVSYGTFAIISMLLANSIENVKMSLMQEQQLLKLTQQQQQQQQQQQSAKMTENLVATSRITSQPLIQQPPAALVITDNHQPTSESINSQMDKQLLKRLLTSSPVVGRASETLVPPVGANGLPLLVGGGSGGQPSGQLNDQIQISDFVLPSNIEILSCVCILVGLIQITMALMRLGYLSLMFSDQLVSSFTCAAAIHVVTSQLGGLFDMSLPSISDDTFKIYHTWRALYFELAKGFNYYTAILSACSILFLLFIKEIVEPRLRKRFKSLTCLPSELFLMVVVILCSWYWKFSDQLDIRIIGQVPTGLPAPQVPRIDLIPYLTEDAITVALISFAMNLSLAQVYAKKYKYKIEPNQELLSLGSSNLISSFFSCFPCGSSLSRTAVQSALNVKSQLSALFSCAIVLSIICFFAPILHDLPRSTLSCIIVVALKGILVQIKDFYENWRLSKLDASVWVVTFVAVLLFGVTYGLLLGIAASLFMIFFRLLTPNHTLLGQLPGTEIYVDSSAFVDCKEVDQVKIFRFNSALCYLNRTMFKSRVEKSLPSIFKPQGLDILCSWRNQHLFNDESAKTRCLVIDCSALAYCDYSGAATLIEILDELAEQKVSVYLAACPMKLIDMLEKMKQTSVLENNVFPSISDAVCRYHYVKSLQQQQQQQSKQSVSKKTSGGGGATGGGSAGAADTSGSSLESVIASQ